MRLYKITSITDDGTAYVWAGTQADARTAQKALYEGSNTKPTIEEIDFPTDKPNLLHWLNVHFVSDNG